MTKLKTAVEQIIEGIETKESDVYSLDENGLHATAKSFVDRKAFDKVVAIALELERQRDDYACDPYTGYPFGTEQDNSKLEAIAKGEK